MAESAEDAAVDLQGGGRTTTNFVQQPLHAEVTRPARFTAEFTAEVAECAEDAEDSENAEDTASNAGIKRLRVLSCAGCAEGVVKAASEASPRTEETRNKRPDGKLDLLAAGFWFQGLQDRTVGLRGAGSDGRT